MQATATDTVIASRQLVRDRPDRSRIVATLEVHRIGGNDHPHFAATCEVYDPHGNHSGAARHRAGRDMDMGGASSSEILAAFPGARAFVDMHLSDYPSGRPMHAAANGWHFLTGKAAAYELEHYGPDYVERQGSPASRAARCLRVEPGELPNDLLRTPAAARDTPELREMFDRYVDALAPRWAAEARAAFELLAMMPTLEQLRGYDMAGEPLERAALPAWLIGADPELVNV